MFFKRPVFILSIMGLVFSCQVTSHNVKPYFSDKVSTTLPVSIDPKKYVEFQVVKVADWESSLAGLLDLDDPKAKAVGLKDRLEPIAIYFYLVKHPKFGTYMIDSGIGENFPKGENGNRVNSIVESQMHFDKLKVYETTRAYLQKNKIDLKGIFFTHLHLDHTLGAYEIDRTVPFYVGPGEVTSRQFINLFVQGSTDHLLGKNPNLIQFDFGKNTNEILVLDFFGDKSFFVLSVPGHTPGSLAFYIPAKGGAHLVLGDSCHTQWGWKEGVIPGKFTSDPNLNRQSLDFLKEVAGTNVIQFVYPGHQERISQTLKK
ncbi:MBL fold metallo-hydrolase [Leptospira sp. 2 VSF19]|uniref:MBL fold metallo-hydrolase n=1 Tax=Leptospira soteropolitanensis TaxID=2950025 RepID=A0AAW5VLF0_9LEPT|nr:MBL fold metallo-hydrolase [Leptospira soteropolitanensis]MCW7494424.1 MBL fold metallo-hydrolase [Leptospira soteropolitanensis]MCW7502019.1 MBL fold metallo-hydrolase [Leptospira soteropolitanensis]MCW7524270.1 MBL fold metallo-hydrolase [Leptospira soteropolitanensis]MCW7528135.1 MBL fold metallo-hydrolase [Leptospira soteropolitanensis]MCW7531989.1 MBL fold metallo-hydrolase [Leptospira soteropolitanensis]